jgi:hypothetical protein
MLIAILSLFFSSLLSLFFHLIFKLKLDWIGFLVAFIYIFVVNFFYPHKNREVKIYTGRKIIFAGIIDASVSIILTVLLILALYSLKWYSLTSSCVTVLSEYFICKNVFINSLGLKRQRLILDRNKHGYEILFHNVVFWIMTGTFLYLIKLETWFVLVYSLILGINILPYYTERKSFLFKLFKVEYYELNNAPTM